MTASPAQHRAVCHSCFRPLALCYCRYLTQIDNRTPVLIIQHPHERFHPLGTARIAERCLRDVRVAVDYDRVLRDAARPLEIPDGAALLFPAAGARDLATLPRSDLPRSLVVLDGTWHQARSLYRDIAALKGLPKVRFDPARPSAYRIRKEPSLGCVSTVEAVVYALEQIEPETEGLNDMLRAFTGMIDLQISAARARPRRPRFARRDQPRGHGLPTLLCEEVERVVVVYGETAIPGQSPPRGSALDRPRELVHWVARRLGTGEHFSTLIRPSELPSERRLCPSGLSLDDLRGGVNMQRARRAWHDFALPQDLILSWNKSTLDMMGPLQHEGPATCMKGIYKNFARRCDPDGELRGSIEEVIEREGLRPAATPLIGRAGLRLAQLEALTRSVHERGVNWARSALRT